MNKMLLFTIPLLLLAINWLTFHDIFEPHTVRDWLTLAVSALIFCYFAASVLRKKLHQP